jgi:hypothetical protein
MPPDVIYRTRFESTCQVVSDRILPHVIGTVTKLRAGQFRVRIPAGVRNLLEIVETGGKIAGS